MPLFEYPFKEMPVLTDSHRKNTCVYTHAFTKNAPMCMRLKVMSKNIQSSALTSGLSINALFIKGVSYFAPDVGISCFTWKTVRAVSENTV